MGSARENSMDDEFPNGPTEEGASDEISLNASSEGDNGEDPANRFRRLLADDLDGDTPPEPSSDSPPSRSCTIRN